MRMTHAYLAGKGDGIGRVGLHAKPFERSVSPTGARPCRKSEPAREANQDAQQDERSPPPLDISPRPKCRGPRSASRHREQTVRAITASEKVVVRRLEVVVASPPRRGILRNRELSRPPTFAGK